MECECDQDAGQGTAVSLGVPAYGTWARLQNRVDPWGVGSIGVCVQIGAPGLLATLHQVTLSVISPGDLVSFFDGLAGDLAGWDGTRVWESMDQGLRVEADFSARGYVSLTWTVTPWRHLDGNWTAASTVVLEAGEQLLQFATRLGRFLAPG
jgi:hypothetical protein